MIQATHKNTEHQDRTIRPVSASQPSLSVTHVSTTDMRGGAAKSAIRLHHALGDEGVLSRMIVAQRFGTDPDIVEYNPLRPASPVLGRMFFRLCRRWNRPSIGKAGAYFSPEWTLTGWRLISQLPPCDLVNLHWVADLLDYRSLPRLAARVPIVWTFHDMNVFTGGCHYSGYCERFEHRCGSCPQLNISSGEHDMTRRIFERKSRVFKRIPPGRLKIVCPSRWLAREAGRSSLCRNFELRVIPGGVDTHEYRPLDQAEARRRLNLPLDAKIVLFVADAVEDRRKGLGLLLDAFHGLRDIPGLLLVTLGRGASPLMSGPLFRQLGWWDDSEMMRAAYSAANVFAVPSVQDNLPNTVLESMACGTPVAGFAVGGIGEAVVDGKSGLLAPVGDTFALTSGIRRILESQLLRHAFAAESRTRIEREYSAKLQAIRYASLYDEIIQSQETGGRVVDFGPIGP